MAYNALNNLIDAYIYANGVQAITGQILNGVLKQMVSQLGSGYHLMGVAGPETVPASNDYAMAYFAATAGEYTDFGGITLAAGEVAVLLTSGNGSWEKQTIYTVPTTTEDLENTAGFITNAVTDLVNYYTKTEVDDTLADYPTLENLATALADYYTKQEIDTTLEGYPTKQEQETALGDYYTKDEMDAALSDRYTKDETDTKLADYYRKAETYDKDEVDSIVAALSRQEYIVAWDGLAAPDVSAIPAGVTVTYSGTTYTGTLAASASTVNKIYMVWNGTAYDMYGTSQDGGYSWVPMGTTTVDLSQYATKAKVSQLEAKVTGSRQNYSSGYLDASGDVNQYATWLHSVDYTPLSTGDTVYWNPGEMFGSAALVIYDANKVKIGYRGANAVERTVTITEQGAAYARLSFAVSNKNNACLKVNGVTVWTAKEEIFGVEDLINETEERIEGQIAGQYTNYQNNSIIDSSGVIYPMSGWIASTDYTPVAPGDVLLWYPNAINGSAALAIYDSNFSLLQWKGANATQREIIVPDGGAFIRASFSSANKSNAIVKNGTTTIWKPKDEILGLEDINYFIGSVTDANSGAKDNISIKDKKVSINSSGVRFNFRGKQLILAGPFDMPYDSSNAPNGAWVIDVKTLSEAVDGSTINLTSSIVKYAASGSEQIKKDVILFTCYYNNIFPVGLFGTIIAEKKSLVSLNNVSIVAIDSLNSSKGNVVLDPENKKVTIKKEGVRLKLSDRFLRLTGSADFDMAYDSTNHPNGGWFLKTSAIQGVSNDDAVALSSDNIVYYSIAEGGYNENILLFACYYNTLIPSGIFGGCLLQRQIDAINIDNPSVEISEAKCKQFAAYFNNSGICETFAFMTDPHLLGLSNNFNEVTFAQYIKTLQKYYDETPVDWCVCGGDWLNNSDYQDIACWKLGYMDAMMRKSFKHYFPVLGNHDTNYQGVVSSEDSSRGDLTHQTLVNLMFRENGNTYYKFKGNNTQFYVFDTGTDWEDWMTEFKWSQIDWFAKALISDDAEHAVIIQHIYYSSGTTVNTMAANIQAVAGAYNSRTTLTLNGITYDFSGCTGKIACAIAGHSHYDDIVTEGVSVPVWLTTNMMDGNTPTFDLCIIDYTAGKMKSVRIGTGSNREMTLA